MLSKKCVLTVTNFNIHVIILHYRGTQGALFDENEKWIIQGQHILFFYRCKLF